MIKKCFYSTSILANFQRGFNNYVRENLKHDEFNKNLVKDSLN